jgi:phosphoribosyl-AMP cyclohydrolase
MIGLFQDLLEIRVDCDGDAMRFTVIQVLADLRTHFYSYDM